MGKFLSTLLFIFFSLTLGFESKESPVYCFHIKEGKVHLEVAHADCFIRKEEFHIKALEDLSCGIEKTKLVSTLYWIPLKGFHLFFDCIEHKRILNQRIDPPLKFIKLLI